MQQALEALTAYDGTNGASQRKRVLTALRERLAQPEQEPVAWEDVLGAIARGWTHEDNKHKTMDVPLAVAIAREVQDMCTAPQPREWVGLTEQDFSAINQSSLTKLQAATCAESILKEKNA